MPSTSVAALAHSFVPTVPPRWWLVATGPAACAMLLLPVRSRSPGAAKMLATLDEREREIIQLRCSLDRGGPHTLEEVGACFGLTRERTRQIEARTTSKVRHPAATAHLHEPSIQREG